MSDVVRSSVSKTESFSKSKSAHRNLRLKRRPRSQRQDSVGVIEELVQCGICLEKLIEPRMLPCQHTFCLSCLHSHFTANRVLLKQTPESQTSLKCPVCQKKVDLEKGAESLNNLPKNLYIDSVLQLVEGNLSPVGPKPDYRCVKCDIFAQGEEQCCQHCMQVFCNVCWNIHLSELESNLTVLVQQIEESKLKLRHKLENFENRCEQLRENIHDATLQKIELLKMDEEKAMKEVESIVREGNVTYGNISTKINDLKTKISTSSVAKSGGKVFSFMNLHRETSRLISSVNHFGEARVIFDKDSFRLDQATEGVYNGDEDDAPNSFEVASQQYRNRSFVPKLVWKKCPRPANVAVPPWDNSLLYIAATDTHSVLILNRDRRKLQGRLTSPEMLYPQGLAFSKLREEIYVSDKWKHCIHVFSKTGDYLREMLQKGTGSGKVRSPDGIALMQNDQLVVSDSGNDRLIVINPQTGDHLSTIGIVNKKTMLNMPTGVAVHGDNIVVADTGNHRIKIFQMDGKKLQEFGALGKNKGQFRSAEVVAVDPLGFILVGDGGNARVQIFKPDGTVAKVFGGDDGFGWVSGIHVTPEFDVIVADSKTRCLKIF